MAAGHVPSLVSLSLSQTSDKTRSISARWKTRHRPPKGVCHATSKGLFTSIAFYFLDSVLTKIQNLAKSFYSWQNLNLVTTQTPVLTWKDRWNAQVVAVIQPLPGPLQGCFGGIMKYKRTPRELIVVKISFFWIRDGNIREAADTHQMFWRSSCRGQTQIVWTRT